MFVTSHATVWRHEEGRRVRERMRDKVTLDVLSVGRSPLRHNVALRLDTRQHYRVMWSLCEMIPYIHLSPYTHTVASYRDIFVYLRREMGKQSATAHLRIQLRRLRTFMKSRGKGNENCNTSSMSDQGTSHHIVSRICGWTIHTTVNSSWVSNSTL